MPNSTELKLIHGIATEAKVRLLSAQTSLLHAVGEVKYHNETTVDLVQNFNDIVTKMQESLSWIDIIINSIEKE